MFSTTLASFTYDPYDKVGNRLTVTELSNQVHNYSYDNLYRLTQATYSQTYAPECYKYDAVGNRTAFVAQTCPNPLPPDNQTYNDANRLVQDYQSQTYFYDPDGNLVKKAGGQTVGYCWDGENQLTQVVLPGGGTVTYRYDGLGRRIEKNEPLQPSPITQYIYDNQDLWETYDGSNSLKDRLLHGLGTDERLRLDRGGLSYFYLVDGLGSVVELVDGNGVVQQAYTYDSFGNITPALSFNQAFTYTGREWEGALPNGTGLYYYRARYYDPQVGRFLSEDPLDQFPSEYLRGLSSYVYVRNNPINYIDPTGLRVIWEDAGVSEAQLLKDMNRRYREMRERGEIKDPDPADIFLPCFLKCMVFGFADDVLIVGSSLLSKAVRKWLHTPAGSCFAKVLGGVFTGGAAVYCANYCGNKVPKHNEEACGKCR